MCERIIWSEFQGPLQKRSSAFQMMFRPLEKPQVFVGVLQVRIEASRLSILVRRLAGSSHTNEHDSAEISNARVQRMIVFGCCEIPERIIQAIILKSFERGLQRAILEGIGRRKKLR